MKTILLFFFSSILLYSNNIELDNLLKEYGNSQELHLKSKKESAGNLIVFSRSDLDKMQAFTLNDVIKTLRMFTLQVNRLGMTTLVKAGSAPIINAPIKLYINSHELSSITLGNAISQYGKMGLYFIDHIEVYQAGNSIAFGNEPGSMIIKLYTKIPSRENGTSAQISIDTKAGGNIRAMDAKVIGEYSYLANIDISKNNFKKYDIGSTEMSRDGQRGQLYIKLSKENSYDIELGASKEKYDIFSGYGKSPIDSYNHTSNGYIRVNKNFDNMIKISLGASIEKQKVDNDNITSFKLADKSSTNHLEFSSEARVYHATVQKRYINGDNDLLIGTEFKHKELNVKKYLSDSIDKNIDLGPTKLNIYMAYFENMYNISDTSLVTLSAKLDYYKNSFSKYSSQYMLRIGYVGLIDDKWTFKFFGIKNYTYPTLTQTTFSPNNKVNHNLQSAKGLIATAELIYKSDGTTISFGAATSLVENAIIFDKKNRMFLNTDDTNSFSRVNTKIEHNFNIDNKITFEYYKTFRKKYFTPGYGALLQLFNHYGKIDIYNELVYRAGYKGFHGTYISAGYDYTLGANYKINKKLYLKLKGENLLDKALSTYRNSQEVPLTQRKATLSMEYTF